jgi:hypothetical protein
MELKEEEEEEEEEEKEEEEDDDDDDEQMNTENQSTATDQTETREDLEKSELVDSLKAQLAMLEGRRTSGSGPQAWSG